jgi:two-component system sensor histidine kinase YesM
MRFLRTSIWAKLMLSYLVIIIIPLLIVGYIVYSNSIKIIEKQTIDNKTNLIMYVNEKIEAYVSQIELFSRTIYLDELQLIMNSRPVGNDKLAIIDHKNQFFSAFNRWAGYMNAMSNINDILWIQPDGRVYSYSNNTKVFSPSLDQSLYQDAQRRNGAPILIANDHRVQSNINSKVPNLSLVRKINNAINQNNLGVLLIDMKFSNIESVFDRVQSQKDSLIIMNRTGELIYPQNAPAFYKELFQQFVNKDLDLSAAGFYDFSKQTFFVTPYFSQKTGWYFFSLDPLDELTSNIDYIKKTTIVAAVLTFFMTLFISLFQSWRIVKPLLLLQHAMKKFQRGDFNIFQKATSDDEIGELTHNFNEMVQQTKLLIQKVYQSEINEKEAHLLAFQSQINPHFLYNTLDTINALSRIHKIPEITKISKIMAEMFRYNADFNKKFVMIEDEITQISRYIELISIRQDHKISLRLSIHSALLKEKVLKFLFQPIVENAVKHGFANSINESRIEINVNADEHQFMIEISDNGEGISDKHVLALNESYNDTPLNTGNHSASHGIGLMNVVRRLKLNYGESATLTIASQKGVGTQVRITFPKVKHIPEQ